MRDRNKNKKSSLTDFIRYHDDKMNGDDRNAFEKELQKDLFAEEAAEGFSMISAENAVNDITELERRLQGRTGKSTLHLFSRITWAAAIATIVIISSVLLITRQGKKPVTISQNINLEIKAPAPVPVTVPEENKPSEAKRSDRKLAVSSPLPAKAAERTEEKEVPEEKISEFQVAEVKDSAVPTPDLVTNTNIAAAERVSSEGKRMESARAAGISLKGKSEQAGDYIPPQPAAGRDTFNLYIEKNIRNPEPGKTIQEVVTLSFLVYGDGTISGIRIIGSPGEDYSREAIRLIKGGPAWKPAMENNRILEDSVRVSIVFK